MAFTQKILNISVGSGGESPTPPFSTSGGGLDFSGLRSSVHIDVSSDSMATCTAKIWGLTFAHMNAISTLGRKGRKLNNNVLTVSAGDAVTGVSEIYRGTIDQAIADFQGATDLPLHIESYAGLYEAVGLKPNPAYTTKQGSTDVAQLIQQLAGKMNLQFENNGVNAKLMNPYAFGSYRSQALKLAQDAGIGIIVHDKGTVAIWPRDGARTSGGGVTVSPQTGLVGYPSASSYGIKIRCLFKPGFQFNGIMTVQGSRITNANGNWVIKHLMFDLECRKPNGQWFVTAEAAPQGGGGGAAPTGA